MSLVQCVDRTGSVKLTTVLCLPSFPWTPVSQCGGQPSQCGGQPSVDNGANWQLAFHGLPQKDPRMQWLVGFARKCLLPGFAPHALATPCVPYPLPFQCQSFRFELLTKCCSTTPLIYTFQSLGCSFIQRKHSFELKVKRYICTRSDDPASSHLHSDKPWTALTPPSHTSYLSRTHGRCPWGKKSVMWRNFKFLYMTDVEKAKISSHLD